MNTLAIARGLHLLSLGLFTGALFGAWFGVSPTLKTLPVEQYIPLQQSLIRSFDPTMPILASLALLSGIAILVSLRDRVQSAPFIFSALSLGFFVITLGLTFAVNVPINIAVMDWSVANPPPDWMAMRDRWEQANTFRTFAAILAFIGQILALDLRKV